MPGCGRGHDVRYLARHGHAAVGFDFSPAAIAEARALADADGVPAGSSRGDFDSSAPIGQLRPGQEWTVLFRKTNAPA